MYVGHVFMRNPFHPFREWGFLLLVTISDLKPYEN